MSKQNKQRGGLESRYGWADLIGGLAEAHPALAIVGLILGVGLILVRVGQWITRVRLGRQITEDSRSGQKGTSQDHD